MIIISRPADAHNPKVTVTFKVTVTSLDPEPHAISPHG